MKSKLDEELSAVEKSLKAVLDSTADPFDAVPKVKHILDACKTGETFILNYKTIYHRFTKCADGKWDVVMGKDQDELETNKASHDSANMTAGEVVNCLYNLE